MSASNGDRPSSPDDQDLTTIYIVRHGESLDNAGIPHERTPEGSPLSERGEKQARAATVLLAGVPAVAVIASNLVRSEQTATIIAEGRDLEVRIIPELHERSVGSFEYWTNLRARPEFRDRFAEYDRGSQAERLAWKLGEDWESLDEALHRFMGGLRRIVQDYRGKTVIAVAHGTVMRAFLLHAGYGTLDQLPEGSVDNTGYIITETDGDIWRIVEAHGIHRFAPEEGVSP